MTNKLIATLNGKVLSKGDKITSFRDEVHTFLQPVRLPEPGRSGKVQTDKGVFYVGVFPKVEVVDEDTLPLSMILDKNDPDYDLYNDDEEPEDDED